MTVKPVWLTYAVDVAQIVSAIATAITVGVAIWLANRGEAQRLKFYSGLYHYTIPNDPFGELRLHVTVVNSGVLPAVIIGTSCTVQIPGFEWSWHFGPTAGQFPVQLEHGQQMNAEVLFELDKAPWDSLPIKHVTSRHIKFTIETSLGRAYVHRPSKAMLSAIRTNLRNARTLRPE